MTWLRLVPAPAWWLLALLVVASVQQWRVSSLQGDLQTAQQDLQTRTGERDACRATRVSLESLVGEQNARVAQLRLESEQRQASAALVQRQAQAEAVADHKAAQRLLQERTGGDACAAAEAVIDQELGL